MAKSSTARKTATSRSRGEFRHADEDSPTGPASSFKGNTGWHRVVRATGYSVEGLRAAFEHESAFRQEVALASVMLPGAIWLGRSWLESALLIATVMLVLITELLNSAIEAAVDRVSLELHPFAARAKDIGSAAVMLALLLCGGVWLAALWQRFGA